MVANRTENEKSSFNILIVEDSLTQAEMLRHLLEENMFSVNVASNVDAALNLVRETSPDLVLSEIIMLKKNGYELCEYIRRNEQTKNIPVILMTSLSDKEDIIKAIACGADSFITKPYDNNYIISQVNEFLKKNNQEKAEKKITVDQNRMLNFILSSYQAAIQQSQEVKRAHDEIDDLNNQLAIYNKERMHKLSIDIEEYKDNQLIKINEERLKKLINADHSCKLIVDKKHVIQYVNHNTELLFEKSADELIGKEFEYVLEDVSSEIEITRNDGSCSIVQLFYTELNWEGKSSYYISLHDITKFKQSEKLLQEKTNTFSNEIIERERLQSELVTLSLKDELTGLYNRRGFMLLAEQQRKLAIRGKEEFIILFSDFNDLKYINDTYGHKKGDESLQIISSVINSTFRDTEVNARMGGDEFAVLISNCNYENALKAVDRLRENLFKAYENFNMPYPLILSIGMSQFDTTIQPSIEIMLKQADKEMYINKAYLKGVKKNAK